MFQTGSTITNLTNDGTISATAGNNNGQGILLNGNSTIGTLTNNDTISGTAGNNNGQGIAIFASSEITNLTNSGTIKGTAAGNQSGFGIILSSNSTVGTLTNSGTITGTSAGTNADGVVLNLGSTITTLTNDGTISGTATGVFGSGVTLNNNNSSITTLTNNGNITGSAGTDSGFGIRLSSSATITNLTNDGIISGSAVNDEGYGMRLVNSTITTLSNDDTISGTAVNDDGSGIRLENSTITTLSNDDTISGTAVTGSDGQGIYVLTGSTMTNLTNDGTISGTAGTNFGGGLLISNNSTLGTLTNRGTISGTATTGDGGSGIRLFRSSTITNLINTGTISATADNNTGTGVQLSGSNITTLTNNGIISATAGNDGAVGIDLVQNSATITNLINTGTISATAGNNTGIGISIDNSTITTLTNTGTITGTAATNAFDIRVFAASNLTNFNNLQSGLTYGGRLPGNYSTIIRDFDNYGSLTIIGTPTESATGDTVYTPFAGTTAIPVYIEGGTYSNVMSGMPDANLSDTVTGTLTGDGVNSVGSATWTLTENGANVWDLSVVGNYAFIDRANTQLTFDQIAKNLSEVFQNMNAGGNFAHMMTYDCNTFGNDGCVSFGGRITNSGGNDHSGTLVLGKKFTDNFRLSGFIDQSIDHNSYTDIQVESNVPLIGLTGVWNKDKDNQGLQVKIGNTYQSNDTDITRNAIGTSESAKGDTTVETQSYIAEASYQITDSITSHRPFVAVRYMQTEMDGYTETNAAAPITYQDMDEESYVAIAGVKTSKKISPEVTLNLGFGLETDLNHNDAQLRGRVVGLSAFNAAAISSDPENSTRQLASIGADFNLAGGHKIGVKGMYQELRYRKDDATTVHVSYTLPF
jgi:uncharacterized protein YhjY with autotransporter beta-barrel domain